VRPDLHRSTIAVHAGYLMRACSAGCTCCEECQAAQLRRPCSRPCRRAALLRQASESVCR